jgi:YebC/PmpR family DNA-binding regulatory protein
MSGHSHYATIKRKKEASDIARGKLFSKISRQISVAVKSGSSNPEMNSKLKMAIEQARAANMPKANIERAISKAAKEGNLEEVTYEGYAPEGVGVVVEAFTDNRNRTSQEIKNIFERGGGTLAGPGAVSFNFEPKGMLLVKKEKDVQQQMLTLIDAQVEDIDETEDGIEVYVEPSKVSDAKKNLGALGFEVLSVELVKRQKSFVTITDPKKSQKIISFLENLEDHDDVQNVYANLDVPEDVASKMEQ